MTVTAFNFIETTCTEADDGSREYDVTIEAITDAITDGAVTVLSHPSAPRRGNTYVFGSESDQAASCRSRSVRYRNRGETRKVWTLNAKYSTKGSEQNPTDSNSDGGQPDPIDWGWKAAGSTWIKPEAPDKDRNNRPFVNVNAEPFLPPPEKERHNPLLTLTKNQPQINLSKWADAQGKVNSVAMWSLDPRCVKLREWNWVEHWLGNGQMYFANTLVVEINRTGFYYQPPNMGFHERVGVNADGTPKTRRIVDERKIPIARPVPLDDAGARALDGAAPLFFDQPGGVLRRFELEDEYDLAGQDILPLVIPGNFLPF